MLTDSRSVKVVNVKEKLSLFNKYWDPKIAGEMNDDKVQLVKVKGQFVWHHHEKEDELFYVLKGHLIVHFRDRDVHVSEGEFVIVPRMLEHMTEAVEETHLLYIEPKQAVNTGNITDSEYTTKNQEII